MKKYDEYKDSGVEWIGEVPRHWEVVPLKRVISINNGSDYKHVQVEDGGYPVIGSGGQFAYASKYMYDGEVVLLGRKGTIDKPLYFKGTFWTVDTMFYGIPKKNANCKYLYYQAKNIPFERYATATALPSMTQTDLNNNSICLPPLSEQHAIATYLDKKCGEIDKVISVQQKRIALLQELKQSIITHAVTKGLDPNVETKESWVEWIGKVPSYWEVVPIKHIAETNSGSTPKNIKGKGDDDSNIKWVRTTDLDDMLVYVNDSSEYLSKTEMNSASCPWLDVDTIVVAMYGGAGTIGKCGILGMKSTINQALCSLEPIGKEYYKYLFYIIKALRTYWMKYAASSRKDPNISQDIIRNMKIPTPPYEEQHSIATSLDKKCASIDSSISKAQHQIDLLQEYKQSLLTEVVTGKRKVC